MNTEEFKRVKPIPQILHILNPKFGRCQICGLPWNQCTGKTIYAEQYNGLFAVCTHCWDRYPIGRLKIEYQKLYEKTKTQYLRYVGHGPIYTLKDVHKAVEEEYKKTHCIHCGRLKRPGETYCCGCGCGCDFYSETCKDCNEQLGDHKHCPKMEKND